MTAQPELPPDADPVCRLCTMPARWNPGTGHWEHAEVVDGVWCSIIFPGLEAAEAAASAAAVAETAAPPALTGLPTDLAADAAVTLPVWVWVNALGILHTSYPPGTLDWADQLAAAIEKAIDA